MRVLEEKQQLYALERLKCFVDNCAELRLASRRGLDYNIIQCFTHDILLRRASRNGNDTITGLLAPDRLGRISAPLETSNVGPTIYLARFHFILRHNF